MNPSILQTQEWKSFQEKNGNKTFSIKKDNYEALCILKNTKVGPYLFLPYGPTLKSKKDLKPALKEIEKIAKENNCFFLRIEPTLYFDEKDLEKYNLKKTKEVEPECTIKLRLDDKTEEEILANIDRSKRNAFRNYSKKGLVIEESKNPEEDIKYTLEFYSKLADQKNITRQSDQYFRDQVKEKFAKLYIAKLEDKVIGASLIYVDETTGYNMYTYTDPEYKKFRSSENLLMYIIFDCKKAGLKYFDFWGATDSEDPNHPWYGFTQYKLQFGGEIVKYTGTCDYIIDNKKYKLYALLRKVNRRIRKITKKTD